MKKLVFLIAAVLALNAIPQANAAGVVAFRSRVVQRQVVVAPVFGFRQQVVVNPFLFQRQAFVNPFAFRQRVVLGFNAGYGGGVQQIQQLESGCGVQAFSAGYGVQQVVVQRNRLCY